jgi:hypothetical protein
LAVATVDPDPPHAGYVAPEATLIVIGTAVAVAHAASDPVPLIVIGLTVVFTNCALSTWLGKQSTAPGVAGLPELFQHETNPGGVVCACMRELPTRLAVKTTTIANVLRMT